VGSTATKVTTTATKKRRFEMHSTMSQHPLTVEDLRDPMMKDSDFALLHSKLQLREGWFSQLIPLQILQEKLPNAPPRHSCKKRE
jgi:hypothetical protein